MLIIILITFVTNGTNILKGKKSLLDTNLFIYLFESHPDYQEKVAELIQHLDSIRCEIITSELTLAECLVKPFADKDVGSQDHYENNIKTSDFLKVMSVSRNTLIKAAELRGLYKNKLPDSIHLASAIEHNCDVFVGNDKRIKIGSEINIFTL